MVIGEKRIQYVHQPGENTGFILLLQIRSMRRDAISPPGKRTGLNNGAIPVLRGAAWHAGAAPEEVHFKLLQMGAAAAALLIFFKKSFMCMGVLPAYMSVRVCASRP